MAKPLFANRATSALTASITDTDLEITIGMSDSALFPSPTGGNWFWVTVVDTSGNYEIMKCTARTTNTLTVVRGQDGTTALSFASGSRCDVRLNAGAIGDLYDSLKDAANITTGTIAEARLPISFSANGKSLVGAANYAAMRTLLSVYSAAQVDAAIAALVASSPAALDTLNELAAALGNDANFATTITNALALKAALASPAFTGTPTIGGSAIIKAIDAVVAGLADNVWTAGASTQKSVVSPAQFKAAAEALAGSGWTQIGDSVPLTSGGPTWAFTDIPQTYNELMLIVEGLSSNNYMVPSLKMRISVDNGSNWLNDALFATGVGASGEGFTYGPSPFCEAAADEFDIVPAGLSQSNTVDCRVHFNNYRMAVGQKDFTLRSASRGAGSQMKNGSGFIHTSSAINAIQIGWQWPNPPTYDAGTAYLFGRR